MCLPRWSLALHLVLLCWPAAALQVIEGKIHAAADVSQHGSCKEIYSCGGCSPKQIGTDPTNECFIKGALPHVAPTNPQITVEHVITTESKYVLWIIIQF